MGRYLAKTIISDKSDWYLFVDYCFPAATADKVTAALADPAASDMKLEDLEAHLNSLKASASKSSIRRFVITEKAPTRAFS